MKRHEAIEDRALDWLIRREGAEWSEQEQSGLDAWLEESLAHKAAFWRAEHGWEKADRIQSLGLKTAPRTRDWKPLPTWWPTALAASLLLVIGAGGLSYGLGPSAPSTEHVQQAVYDTPVGGRRLVPLADGSKIELNTRTKIRTAVGPGKRDVWLDTGEAFFEVAHRDGEPFVVHAGKQTITVLGTKFSVRRDGDRVTVSVLEGRVRVDDGADKTAHAVIISGGDIAISRGTSTLVTAKSDERVASALAWRDGMLSFDNAPLDEVAAEFNRYNHVQLEVTDKAAADIPIGGSFQASSADSFVRLLRDAYGLKIERNDDIVKISSQ